MLEHTQERSLSLVPPLPKEPGFREIAQEGIALMIDAAKPRHMVEDGLAFGLAFAGLLMKTTAQVTLNVAEKALKTSHRIQLQRDGNGKRQ